MVQVEETQLQLLDVGIVCPNCSAEILILTRDVPFPGYYFCTGCEYKIKLELREDELSDGTTEDS